MPRHGHNYFVRAWANAVLPDGSTDADTVRLRRFERNPAGADDPIAGGPVRVSSSAIR